MSRKQRKIAAEQRRKYMIDEWLDDLQKLIVSGLTYAEATERMANNVADLIRRNPQEKQEIKLAWAEMFRLINSTAAKMQTEMTDEPELEEPDETVTGKLTAEQVENWRNVLVHSLGPIALMLPEEEIQAIRDQIQSCVDADT